MKLKYVTQTHTIKTKREVLRVVFCFTHLPRSNIAWPTPVGMSAEKTWVMARHKAERAFRLSYAHNNHMKELKREVTKREIEERKNKRGFW